LVDFEYFSSTGFHFIIPQGFISFHPVLLQVVLSGLLGDAKIIVITARGNAPKCKSIGRSETEAYEEKLLLLNSPVFIVFVAVPDKAQGFISLYHRVSFHPVLLQVVPSGLLGDAKIIVITARGKAPVCKSIGRSET
jgi:hypothetical protein